MWMIRGYGKDDELRAEYSLDSVSLRDLEDLLGFAPTQLGSTPLDDEQFARIARQFALPLNGDGEHFLDFDAVSEKRHGVGSVPIL